MNVNVPEKASVEFEAEKVPESLYTAPDRELSDLEPGSMRYQKSEPMAIPNPRKREYMILKTERFRFPANYSKK